MADRCIKWERPYASTGYGHPTSDRSGYLAYDPEKNAPSGFDNAYTAEVEPDAEPWRVGGVEWVGSVWEGTEGRTLRSALALATDCPPSIATDRSCRRKLDRKVAANPPTRWRPLPGRPRGHAERWHDEIAPTGPWKCVEYDDG